MSALIVIAVLSDGESQLSARAQWVPMFDGTDKPIGSVEITKGGVGTGSITIQGTPDELYAYADAVREAARKAADLHAKGVAAGAVA